MNISTADSRSPDLVAAREAGTWLSRRCKLAAALGVLAVGFALAWSFGRRPVAASVSAEARLAEQFIAEASPGGADRIDSTWIPSETPRGEPQETQDPPFDPFSQPRGLSAQSVAISESAPERPANAQDPPPERRVVRRIDPPTPPPSLEAENWQPPAPPTAPLQTVEQKPENTIHVVHNGDTLERLARRYLGDESRALEIFQLNRDVLNNPHILPIGAELRVPPRSSEPL